MIVWIRCVARIRIGVAAVPSSVRTLAWLDGEVDVRGKLGAVTRRTSRLGRSRTEWRVVGCSMQHPCTRFYICT